MVLLGSTKRRECEPRRWRYGVQRQYRCAREQVNALLRDAMESRAQAHNEGVPDHNNAADGYIWTGSRRAMLGS